MCYLAISAVLHAACRIYIMHSEIKPTENSSTYKLWFWLQQWYSYIVHLSALILYDFF